MSVKKELAEKHYIDLKNKKPGIYENTLKYIIGEFHTNRVLAIHASNSKENAEKEIKL